MVSVICCYNNQNVFNQMLMKSILNQSMEIELIGIDNSSNKYKSAASALNYGASISKGEYLIFAHQDIEFTDKNLIKSIVSYLNENNQSIVGVAGAKESRGGYTNITHGELKTFAGKNQISEPTSVQTIDECLMAIKKNIFVNLLFDDTVCDDWHLYGVDLCLSAIEKKCSVVVLPVNLYHLSTGIISRNYYKTLWKLVKKHRKSFKSISTTNTFIKTYRFYVLLYKIKLLIVNWINYF
jgi:glycosyltransferase involved in cell wall biosynthesis